MTIDDGSANHAHATVTGKARGTRCQEYARAHKDDARARTRRHDEGNTHEVSASRLQKQHCYTNKRVLLFGRVSLDSKKSTTNLLLAGEQSKQKVKHVGSPAQKDV